MTGLALKIVGGEIEQLPDAPLTLEWMQEQLGGYIEVALTNGMGGTDRVVVWCNEDGLVLRLPANVRRCTDGWLLRGPLLVMGCDRDGENRPLTPGEAADVYVQGGVLYLDGNHDEIKRRARQL